LWGLVGRDAWHWSHNIGTIIGDRSDSHGELEAVPPADFILREALVTYASLVNTGDGQCMPNLVNVALRQISLSDGRVLIQLHTVTFLHCIVGESCSYILFESIVRNSFFLKLPVIENLCMATLPWKTDDTYDNSTPKNP
jgi:hypothetical protein